MGTLIVDNRWIKRENVCCILSRLYLIQASAGSVSLSLSKISKLIWGRMRQNFGV